jgi:anaerobic selenocysteine-containing dehydrogenase
VTISSKGGHITAKVQFFNGAAPGMVYVPQGLGHKAFGMYLKGKGDNFQDAVQISMDALSGQPNWSLTAVRVEKAKGVAHV